MSTRSDIIVHRKDGQWARVYCHYDGYLDHNGRILFDHYTSQKQAEALVKPGDMSSLEAKCSKPKGHSYDKKVEGYTVYYGRDRGEKGTAVTLCKSLQEAWPVDSGTEFTYVWNDGKWMVGDPDLGPDSLVDLGDALLGKVKLTPNIKAFGVNFVIGKHSGKVS